MPECKDQESCWHDPICKPERKILKHNKREIMPKRTKDMHWPNPPSIPNKVAFDIHGVIDSDPEFFSWLSHRLRDNGYIIYIVTGGKYADNARLLNKWKVHYDHFYSITDHHRSLGTPMLDGCADGDICISDDLWDRAKGDYCKKHDIHLIVDDTPRYEQFFHETHFERW